jgi:hypothetical protein
MLVIVPSRGRPDNIAALVESFGQTRAYAELLVVVDDDDEMLERYELVMESAPSWASLEITERKRLGPTLNEYAVKNAAKYDILGFMGDDHRPRTHHWDRRFAAAMAHMGGVGMAYGNDLLQGPNLPTAAWMSSCIVETLGYMLPPGLTHLYIDDAWKALGMRINKLTYVGDVVIEHLHPVAHKAEWDEGYAEVNSGTMYENDGKVFHAYLQNGLHTDAEKILEKCINR